MSFNFGVNLTHTRFEGYVDTAVGYVAQKTADFAEYLEDNRELVDQVGKASKFAIAAILLYSNPVTIVTTGAVGFIARVFSEDQVKQMEKQVARIEKIPFPVQALVGVVAMTYCPVVFSICAGVVAGVAIGSLVPRETSQTIAEKADEVFNS